MLSVNAITALEKSGIIHTKDLLEELYELSKRPPNSSHQTTTELKKTLEPIGHHINSTKGELTDFKPVPLTDVFSGHNDALDPLKNKRYFYFLNEALTYKAK